MATELLNWNVIKEIISIATPIFLIFYFIIKLTISKEVLPIKSVMEDFKKTMSEALIELKGIIKENVKLTNDHTKEIGVIENAVKSARHRIDEIEQRVDNIQNAMRGVETDIARIKTVCEERQKINDKN